jgi:hypothetical protein
MKSTKIYEVQMKKKALQQQQMESATGINMQ